MTPEAIQASLAPPGAGIPFLHRMLGRLIIKPLLIQRAHWLISERFFKKNHELIKKEFELFPKDLLTERILVPPQMWLEDSSRYWSAAMCARHLTIVGKEIEAVLSKLSQGEVITKVADTAAVKPELFQNSPSTIQEYVSFGDSLTERLRASVKNRNSQTTFNHPWFGSLRAKDWMFLLGMHTLIHLKQVRIIRETLIRRTI